MVAVLVASADPQTAVEEEVEGAAVVAAGEDDLLDVGLERDADVLAVDRVACGPFEVVDQDGGRGEQAEDGEVGDDQEPAAPAGEVAAEQPEDQGAARDHVDRAGEQGAGQLAQEGSSRNGNARPPTSAPT